MTAASATAIVQARMTSRRFPGKVLAVFRGLPILEHVCRAVEQALPPSSVMVATSHEASDDPIAAFATARGTRVVRGELENVLARLQLAARSTDSEWILRVSADSPLLDGEVLSRLIGLASAEWDVITTVRPRTFPKGRNAELVRRSALLAIDPDTTTAAEREHVMPYFYSRPDAFRIRNLDSGHPEWSDESLAVDTADDLERLERLADVDLSRLSSRGGRA